MNQKTIVYSFLLSCSLAIVYFFVFDFIRYNQADTSNFVNATKILFGADGFVDHQSRITKPFVLLIPGVLYTLFSVSITTTMLIQNIIFFCFGGVLFAKLLELFHFNLRSQLLGVFLLYTIQPIVVHSFELINDISGYFFTILCLYYYFYIKAKDTISIYQYLLLALFLTAGILSKESVGIAAIILFVDSFINFKKDKLYRNSFVLMIAVILVLLVQIVILHYYSYPSNVSNVLEKINTPNSFIFTIEQFIHSFDVYWLYIVLGLWISLKQFKTNALYRLLAISSIVCFPFLFLWPSVQDRTISVIAPLFVMLILVVFEKLQNKNVQFMLLICAGICNIVFSYIIYKYSIQGILSIYYLGFLLVFGLVNFSEIKKLLLNN